MPDLALNVLYNLRTGDKTFFELDGNSQYTTCCGVDRVHALPPNFGCLKTLESYFEPLLASHQDCFRIRVVCSTTTLDSLVKRNLSWSEIYVCNWKGTLRIRLVCNVMSKPYTTWSAGDEVVYDQRQTHQVNLCCNIVDSNRCDDVRAITSAWMRSILAPCPQSPLAPAPAKLDMSFSSPAGVTIPTTPVDSLSGRTFPFLHSLNSDKCDLAPAKSYSCEIEE